MSRLVNAFSQLAKIAYLTAGDTDTMSAEYFLALARGGANVLEVGIPFSDPVADGIVIQQAMERSIKCGTDVNRVLSIVRQIRQHSEVAIVLFTYYNPIQADLLGFLTKAKAAGADGILVVDLPYEEADELRFLCQQLELAAIAVTAPSSSLARIKLLADSASGFLYYACRKGTTGVRDTLADDLTKRINEVQQQSCLPVAVGFGVANNAMVKQILQVARGCVVGSYFVDAIAHGATVTELEQLCRDMFAC